jgi:hypothetical protein
MILAFAFNLPTDGYPQGKTPPNNVCAIADHLEDFIGKRVSFSATVMSDGLERTILVNVDGSRCKRGMVPVGAADDPRSKEATNKLSRAIFTGHPGTLDKRITAVFTGVISLGDPEQFMLAPGGKVGVVTLESVDDIRIEPIPSAK